MYQSKTTTTTTTTTTKKNSKINTMFFVPRGTADSDNWHLHLAEKPMVRSYHLLDYD